MRELGQRGVGTYTKNPIVNGRRFDVRTQRLADIPNLPADLSHVFVLFGDINPDRIFREPEATRAINVDGTIRLLEEIIQRGLTPVYLSTDYVFDGVSGNYSEQDPVAPTTAYGRQKVEVETWLRARPEPWLICRSSKIVSGEIGTHSVLGQWIGEIRAGSVMRCAVDQSFSPALDADMAKALVALADGGHTGIFHVAGPETTSRYELAKLLTDAVLKVCPGQAIKLEPAHLADFPFAELRPLKTWLNVSKLLSTVNVRFTPMVELCRSVAQDAFGKKDAAPVQQTAQAARPASGVDAILAENHTIRVELGRLQAQIVAEEKLAGMPIPQLIERYQGLSKIFDPVKAENDGLRAELGRLQGQIIAEQNMAGMPVPQMIERYHSLSRIFDPVKAENDVLRAELGRLQAQVNAENSLAGMPLPQMIEQYRAFTSVPRRLQAHQVAFLHIGKAAGTSIHHLLIAAMPEAKRCHWSPELFDSATPEMFEGIGLVLGHFSWNHVQKLRRPTWLLTFLRDPVERVLSSYYYLRESDPVEDEDDATMWAKRLTLEEFLESDRPAITTFTVDHQCYALTSDWRTVRDPARNRNQLVAAALENLSTFGFVGFVEEFTAGVKALCAMLDLDPTGQDLHLNATRQRPLRSNVSARTIGTILERNKGDMAMYEAARRRYGGGRKT